MNPTISKALTMFRVLFLVIFILAQRVSASPVIKIAAAADLKFVMQKLIADFKTKNPAIQFSENYGSSGNFVVQIKNGADFDIFFSADTTYTDQLIADHLTESTKPLPYAKARLALCGSFSLDGLKDKKIKKIAIANPSHAPYGRIAIEALKNAKVYDDIKTKLVFGESVSQAAQYYQIEAAEAAVIAQSLVLANDSKMHNCSLIEANLYSELIQSFVVLKSSKTPDQARLFAHYILSSEAQAIFEKNGFASVGIHQTP